MILGDPKRLGWFKLDMDTAQPLYGSPGTHFDGAWFLAHRSHLPLLETPEALKALTSKPASDWAARDLRLHDRGIKLRTTQHQAIDFSAGRRGVLLGDDMRLGKTLASLMMHDEWSAGKPNYGPLVIIGPLNTRAVWLGWIKRLWPDLRVGVIAGHKLDREVLKCPIVFGHYNVIPKWQALFPIGTLILDEAHALTKPKSKRSLAAVLLASQAKRVVALTGTPIWKLPPDLWNVLGLVEPGAWGSFYDFAERYGAPVRTAHGTTYTGVSHEAELAARLGEVMLRRRWVDCCDDLPAITRSVVIAEVSQAEQNKLDVLAGKLREERTNTIGNLAAYRREVTKIKLATVVEQAQRVLNDNRPVVIWTWHKDYAKRLETKLKADGRAVFMIHGEIHVDKRDAAMDAWKAHPNAALIATMAVAQAGIDLSHARSAIFAELDYTPAVLGQAEMRTFMPSRPMDVTFVIANHIVDQRLVRALIAKLGASDPLGVGAAVDAIDSLRDALMGPVEDGDLDRLLEDILAGVE